MMKHFADPYKCCICGIEEPNKKKNACRSLIEKHHIIEQCNGGGNEASNIIFVCSNHHSEIHLGLIEPIRWYFSTKGYVLHWKDLRTGEEHFGIKSKI